ncbi:PrnB family protein [Sphingomonas sp. PR090111-T3T-6A]|uniref:PrnB family protein n=1 Tax=Sphingomonas sp. PR090111-T3T-6A TaxID=685778 RepID=UPI0003A0AF4D|nr:monodechloroaminopyrrolnitrin synthase PrnB family protein [Sphingomonas sp. PR090111-T3T-6A]
MMGSVAESFDRWIRGAFVEMNSALERLYFAQEDRGQVEGVGDAIKQALHDEGHAHVVALWREGNTGDGFESAFGVLGNVGMYLAALRRHELTNPAREERSPFREASSLALDVGTAIGMAPRFATAHLATHNRAIHGLRKSFTDLPDEFLFIDENARGILAFQRAADALGRIVPLGVTNPVADTLFAAAADAMREVIAINQRLFDQLDVARFFWSVRPYYKPYRVGRQEYRGANAGDFSGINEIDLLLGLCRASDPYYAQLLVDKMAFMLPGDQARLRETMRHRSLMDELLMLADDHAGADWFQANARAFLDICDLYAETARQHHDALVRRFIEEPSEGLAENRMAGLTASGPPLAVLLRSLETLRDFRMAAPRHDIETRADDLARLRAAAG